MNAITGAQSGGSITSIQDNPSNRISDIRPEDVENVEILKGASAAAIYGSRAAAGVIPITTTKKGKPGRTKITLSQDLGMIKVSKLLGGSSIHGGKSGQSEPGQRHRCCPRPPGSQQPSPPAKFTIMKKKFLATPVLPGTPY